MSNINYSNISSLFSNWLIEISGEQIHCIDEELVKKAINIVIYLHPKNTDEVFLQLCALNLLNAAIKIETYQNHLSYDLIKTNAAKLVANDFIGSIRRELENVDLDEISQEAYYEVY